MKGLVYHPLTVYLTACQANDVQLSFEDVERILARPLPLRAYQPVWWANTRNSAQARAWLDAGWVARSHARVGVVTFRRRQREESSSPPAR
jgi:hypothetical protein